MAHRPTSAEEVEELLSDPPPDTSTEYTESVERLSRDLKAAAATLTVEEARFLVAAYYAMQQDRIRAAHRIRTLSNAETPHELVVWVGKQRYTLERRIATALDVYSASKPLGVWARSIVGIGPIISSGLLAHIEIGESTSELWRFAGQDPTSEWLGKERASEIVRRNIGETRLTGGLVTEDIFRRIAHEINVHPERLRKRLTDFKTGEISMRRDDVVRAVAKRPWNADLKRLLFLVGESFVKVSNRPNDIFGGIYRERKQFEEANNAAGRYADQAAAALKEKHWGDATQAKQHYLGGHLPPARIHARARRYAVKMFLSDYHTVGYWLAQDELPRLPYIIGRGAHRHYRVPANADLVPGLAKALRRLKLPE